ncbi:hypothetical protein D3C86_2201140 [compost metagenome]
MDHGVLEHGLRDEDEVPVEVQDAVLAAAAPQVLLLAQAETSCLDPQAPACAVHHDCHVLPKAVL